MSFVKKIGLFALFLGLLYASQTLLGALINEYYLHILCNVGIQILMAVSLNFINGYTGLFSLGHAGFMAIGAYSAALFSLLFWPALEHSFLANFPVLLGFVLLLPAVLLGGTVSAAAGFFMGLPTLRLKGDYLAVATLGFGEIIRILILNLKITGGATGLSQIPILSNFFWIFLSVACTLWVLNNLIRAPHGKIFLAIREDEIAAESIGISTTRYKVTAFSIGAFFAGVAGGLFGHLKGYLGADMFGFLKSVEILMMVVLGGLGSMRGSVIAAVVLTLLSESLRSFAEWRMVIYAVVVILMMIVRAQGWIPSSFRASSSSPRRRGS